MSGYYPQWDLRGRFGDIQVRIVRGGLRDMCKKCIRANAWTTAFATFHIELYHVVDYPSKWSANFHMHYMLENYFI